MWLSKGKVRWCFSATGSQNYGTPGVISFQRWQQQVFMPWLPTCAATVRRIGRRPLTNTRFLHLVGDMVGLLDALGQETAVSAGHDWGAPVAWHAALLRPDRFRAVIGLSVPFIPRGPDYPSKSYPETDDTVFYQSYFQSPGVAEADLEHDVRFTMRAFLHDASSDALDPATRAEQAGHVFMVPRQGGMMANRVNPPSLPRGSLKPT